MNLAAQRPKGFQGKALPDGATLMGTAALVHAFQVAAPVKSPVCSLHQNAGEPVHIRVQGRWQFCSKEFEPESTIVGHLDFAMQFELMDLLVLKRLFLALPQESVLSYVSTAPEGAFRRRAWYLYELLTGRRLDLLDLPPLEPIDLLDQRKYFTANKILSRRHQVLDNLLGTQRFCPMIRRTPTLEQFLALDLSRAATQLPARVSATVIAPVSHYVSGQAVLVQNTSRQINRNREAEQWSEPVAGAGKEAITLDAMIRVHKSLMGEAYSKSGLRTNSIYVGERLISGEMVPMFIGARVEDLVELIAGLIEANNRMQESAIDAVLQGAATSRGLVQIHPFADGNGRMHRYLFHHILTQRGFTPQGQILPVGSAMLEWRNLYRKIFARQCVPLMPFIDWLVDQDGHIAVINDTVDLYRFYDCTEAAEFWYGCVERAIEASAVQTKVTKLRGVTTL